MESIIWRPGIGDPTVIGWITTIGYVLSAFLCARKARGLKTDVLKADMLKADTLKSEMLTARTLKSERLVWCGLAAVLFFLGLNKQLDFQTLLIECGRNLAVSGGWLAQRRKIQAAFVVVTILFGGLILFTLARKQKRFFQNNPPVIIGICLLVLYISLRLTAIDHVGQSSGMVIPDEAWWLTGVELGGIACIGMTAGWNANWK